jgi:hypothetical protein
MVLVERMQALGDHARASRWRGDERSEEKEEKKKKKKNRTVPRGAPSFTNGKIGLR